MSTTKVPWEPYKAATKNLTKHTKSTPSNHLDLDNNNLIRYKVSTDLGLFNARRPGYQFNDDDVKLVATPHTNGRSNEPSTFIDARFYTDFHFLKLADELKNKCMETNSPILKSPNKPVNVVVPIVIDGKANEVTGVGQKIPKSHVNKYVQKIEYLENQMTGLYEHLQIQTQVNSELKKLLVASMGEDIQYKIERLVNDKERLNYELVNLKQAIGTQNEEIEQNSIKCDLWRSKFLACRLMSDEASTWKSFLLLLNKQNEKVLRSLLTDSGLLNEKLNEALELLSELNPEGNNVHRKDCDNLKSVNLMLLGLKNLGKIHNKTLINDPGLLLKLPKNNHPKTENETIGSQMLEQFEWVTWSNIMKSEEDPSTIDSFNQLEQLIARIKLSRATVHSRLFQSSELSGDFDLLVNVCTMCKGKIQIV